MLTLAHPWLLGLLVLPLVLERVLPPHREVRRALAVPFLGRLAALTGRAPGSGAVVLQGPLVQRLLTWVVWALIVLALARPQYLEAPITKTVPTRDLLLAVDLSGSMETQDFTDASGARVDRLTAVKQVLDDFLTKRQGDRVGLIVFGSSAFVQVPFTDDLQASRALLDETQVRMAGPQTAFGDAIGLALTVFAADGGARDRVLIALTDGNDTGSQVPPVRAAEIAHDRGVVIHTIAVGDPTAAGEQALDEETLRAVATATGGRYARANDRDALARVYAELDALRTRPVETMSHQPRVDLFHLPLAAALLLVLGYHAVWIMRRGVARGVPVTAVLALPLAFGDMHLLRPWWLLALLPTAALFLILRARFDDARAWRGVIADHLLPFLLTGRDEHRGLQPPHLLLAGGVLMTLAVAGPTWRREPSPFGADQAALVIAIEVTPTMLAQDVQPSRLARAAQKVRDLLARRPGAPTALIAYAGSAHLVLPLTIDAALVARFADELVPDVMPVPGNVPSPALALAADQLRTSGVLGSILLVTDGVGADDVARLAAWRAQSPLPVQVLAVAAGADATVPAGSPPAPALDRQTLDAAAGALDASVTVVTADDADVRALARRVATDVVAAGEPAAGTRWRDEGWWLGFGVAAIALVWFRPGWVVPWR
ncbi:MAG TPA: VWA domain-containing protein [Candidatus Binatia bacterium]|nr:VWA domain-containing protein [Candidatus Binatia bacterium]